MSNRTTLKSSSGLTRKSNNERIKEHQRSSQFARLLLREQVRELEPVMRKKAMVTPVYQIGGYEIKSIPFIDHRDTGYSIDVYKNVYMPIFTDLLERLGLRRQGWTVRLSNSKMQDGLTLDNRREIHLSKDFVTHADPVKVREIFLHECAHALVGKLYPGEDVHGKRWQAKMRELGQTPNENTTTITSNKQIARLVKGVTMNDEWVLLDPAQRKEYFTRPENMENFFEQVTPEARELLKRNPRKFWKLDM